MLQCTKFLRCNMSIGVAALQVPDPGRFVMNVDPPRAWGRTDHRAAPFCVPGMALMLEVRVLFVALVAGSDSRRQLRRREAGWGGSWRQSAGPTYRNRIRGRRGRVTRQNTGTPDSHPERAAVNPAATA